MSLPDRKRRDEPLAAPHRACRAWSARLRWSRPARCGRSIRTRRVARFERHGQLPNCRRSPSSRSRRATRRKLRNHLIFCWKGGRRAGLARYSLDLGVTGRRILGAWCRSEPIRTSRPPASVTLTANYTLTDANTGVDDQQPASARITVILRRAAPGIRRASGADATPKTVPRANWPKCCSWRSRRTWSGSPSRRARAIPGKV